MLPNERLYFSTFSFYFILFSRLCDLLPPKIQQWQSSPCIAEEYNKKSLEKIRRQQQMCQQRLNELYVKHQELNALIERAKQSPIVEAEQEVSLHFFHNPPHTHTLQTFAFEKFTIL